MRRGWNVWRIVDAENDLYIIEVRYHRMIMVFSKF